MLWVVGFELLLFLACWQIWKAMLWDVGSELLLFLACWQTWKADALGCRFLWDVGFELLLFLACWQIWKADALGCNVNVPCTNGAATVIFAGPEGPSRRLLSITGGFRADVCGRVYIGGSGDNNGAASVIFFRPGMENPTENGEQAEPFTRQSKADPDS